MIKRILNIMRMDMTAAFRDSITIYSLVSPVMLAVILRLIVPSVSQPVLTIPVGPRVPERVVGQLAEYGTVEVYRSRERLQERVSENDDVVGVYYDNGYVVLAEGNEDEEAASGIAAILSAAIGISTEVDVSVSNLKGDPAPVSEYGAVMILMVSLLIGGLLIGFSIVDEKESRAIRALAVAPLRISEYIIARGFLALAIGVIAGVISCTIILGPGIDYARLLLSIVFSLTVAIPFGFVIGAFSDTQMKAFALVKLLMVVFLTFPFVSIFVPGNWQWAFFVFPNYWMFMTMANVFLDTAFIGFAWSAMLTVTTGAALTAVLFPKLKQGLQLR